MFIESWEVGFWSSNSFDEEVRLLLDTADCESRNLSCRDMDVALLEVPILASSCMELEALELPTKEVSSVVLSSLLRRLRF